MPAAYSASSLKGLSDGGSSALATASTLIVWEPDEIAKAGDLDALYSVSEAVAVSHRTVVFSTHGYPATRDFIDRAMDEPYIFNTSDIGAVRGSVLPGQR